MPPKTLANRCTPSISSPISFKVAVTVVAAAPVPVIIVVVVVRHRAKNNNVRITHSTNATHHGKKRKDKDDFCATAIPANTGAVHTGLRKMAMREGGDEKMKFTVDGDTYGKMRACVDQAVRPQRRMIKY